MGLPTGKFKNYVSPFNKGAQVQQAVREELWELADGGGAYMISQLQRNPSENTSHFSPLQPHVHQV